MRNAAFLLLLSCSSPQGSPPAPPPPDPSRVDGDDAGGGGFAEPPPGPAAVDAAPPPPPDPEGGGPLTYMSDCSLTHPVARDTCSGQPPDKRGLTSCASSGIAKGQACADGAPSCYVERDCGGGRKAISEYLICAAKPPGRCYTRSSRRYKQDVSYLSPEQGRAVARQIQELPLARFRHTDAPQGPQRLGFLTEDALASDFVSADGRTVDLYALQAAAIAAIQEQQRRIEALERRLEQCR